MKELDEKNNKNKVWCYIKDRVWLNENMIKEYFPFFLSASYSSPSYAIVSYYQRTLDTSKENMEGMENLISNGSK